MPGPGASEWDQLRIQWLFAIFFADSQRAIALAVVSAAGLRDRGWLVLSCPFGS
jgi:hypothetical protein